MTAPAADRVYFPVRREPRLTVPPVDAPTLADIVWSYFDDLDNPSTTDLSGEAATGNGADAIGGDPGAEPSWLVGSTSPGRISHLRRKS